MANTKTPAVVETLDDVPARDRERAQAENPALVQTENTEELVTTTSVRSEYVEFPKWMYHRDGDSRIVDNLAEVGRLPGEAADWHPDVNHWRGIAGGAIRSPKTGGSADPAIRAAASAYVPDEDALAVRMPEVEHRSEAVVTIMGGFKDPQREEAIADTNASAARKR